MNTLKHLFKLSCCIGGFTLLAGCMGPAADPAPYAQDSDGRAVVTGTEAANAFAGICHKTKARQSSIRRAAKKGGFQATKMDKETDIVSLRHPTKSMSVMSISSGNCLLTYETGESGAKAAAAIALPLIPLIKPTTIGGKKGGGRIVMPVSGGKVIVSNNKSAPGGLRGASATYYKN